ncbi:MAG: hypothetical protein JWO97_4327 [Acidobacteria bacterium]|nr:hypothetical protein [Acidobacteriota bacterium]
MPTETIYRESETPSSSHSTRTMRDVAQNALSTDNLIDIVQRLGLVDIVVNRLRARVEETDVDTMIDDATAYLRRNPEMVVVALGTLTVAAAAVVFLTTREEDENERPSSSSRARSTRSQRDDIDTTPSIGRSTTSTTSSRPRSSTTSSSRRGSTPRE